MADLLKVPELDFNVRINRFLICCGIIVTEVEGYYNKKKFKFNLKKDAENVITIFDELLDETYSSFKRKFGEERYNGFIENYNENLSELFDVYYELEDKYDKLVLLSLLIEKDLRSFSVSEVGDKPKLMHIIGSFNKGLKSKYPKSYKVFNNILNKNEYYIKDKKYYDFYIKSGKIKIPSNE
jgi:hypothetical protein